MKINTRIDITLITALKNKEKKNTTMFIYYITPMVQSYINIDDNTYFPALFRDHLTQTIQGIQFTKYLKIPTMKNLEDKI